jgi:hypothetical protein
VTPAAIEAAARSLHRFNAPRVANDVESWDQVTPVNKARWLKQAELALIAAAEAAPEVSRDPFADLSRPNIYHDNDVTVVERKP